MTERDPEDRLGKMALVLFGGAVLVLACAPEGRHVDAPEPAVPAVVGEATITDVPAGWEAVGTVRSRTVAVLSSKVVGQVVAVRAREGDTVETGETLLEIDARDAVAGLRKAEAGLEAARATYRRYRVLVERGSVSRQEFEEVETRFRAAEADAAAARTAVSWARVASPIDGVVSAKTTEVGSLAVPGVPLLTVEDDSTYRLETLVEESRLGAVRSGGTVRVRVDALDGAELPATVGEITPSADPATRSFLVKLDLPVDPRLRSGMFGRARFADADTTALTVPATAVVDRGAIRVVFAVDDEDTARFRIVKLGRRHGDRVEVLSGLDSGERIVVVGAERLRDGARITRAAASLSGPER